MSLEDRHPFGPGPGPGPAPAPSPLRPPDQSIPYVCWAIIGTCVAVFALEYLVLGTIDEPNHFGMLYGPAVQRGQLWRLATHVFEHAGPIHILFNMSAVASLGFPLERAIGRGMFAVISFVTALGSAALALLFSFDVPMLGASGMILGWAGVFLPILTPDARRALASRLVPVAIISLLPGVSWQGHLGGFLFGLAGGLTLRLGRKRFWALAPFLCIGALGAALAATHSALHPGL